jgi:lysophospholipase L1-like esterase
MTLNRSLIAYLVLLHLLLGLVLVKSDFLQRTRGYLGVLPPEMTRHYHDMVAYHRRMDEQVPDGAVVFIGDSITQSLAVSNVSTNSFNYGIGSDTTFGVLQRIGTYRSLNRAETVVLAIGVNDLKRRDPDEIIRNYEHILEKLPKGMNIVISALHPVDDRLQGGLRSNQRIQQVNQSLKQLAEASDLRVYCDITPLLIDSDGNLKAAYHVGDGIHLSAAGYALWTEALRNAIGKLRQDPQAALN